MQTSPFSFLVAAIIIASTYFANPRREDQGELARVDWLNTEIVDPQTVTHLTINRALRIVTLLICPMT